MVNAAVGCCACSVCTLVIAGIIMIIASFSKLENTEVGLEYNPNAISINKDKIYERGNHFLGLGHRFIKFSKNLRTIQMGSQSGQSSKNKPDKTASSLVSRTKDALLVDLVCSFQYRVETKKENLISLFETWGESYEASFIRLSRNILRDEMARFEALNIFYNRTLVEKTMREALKKKLLKWNAIVDSFQLLDITLPRLFSSALSETENLNLQIKTVSFKKSEEQQKAEGKRNKAKKDADVIINAANGYAAQIQSVAQTKSESIKAKMNTNAKVLSKIKAGLNLNDRQMATFYFFNSLNPEKYNSMTLNLEMPAQINCLSNKGTCV